IFNIVNTLLTVIPLLIVSWVLVLLYKSTFKKIPGSNIVLILCFSIMWGLAIWMLVQDFSTKVYEVEYQAVMTTEVVDGVENEIYEPITDARPLAAGEQAVSHVLELSTNKGLKVGETIGAHLELGKYIYLDSDAVNRLEGDYSKVNEPSQIVHGTVSEIKDNEVEITVSWFSILNSFFIIALASLFTKWWDSKYNPSAAVKYGLYLL